MRPEEIIDITGKLAELDIPVSSGFFRRDFANRFGTIAEQLSIVENATARSPISNMTPEDLEQSPPHVAIAYQRLMQEIYEQCALLEVMGRIDGEEGAIAMWRHYLFLAQGHPDQATRLKIAQKHLMQLEKDLQGEKHSLQELETLRRKRHKETPIQSCSESSHKRDTSLWRTLLRSLFGIRSGRKR